MKKYKDYIKGENYFIDLSNIPKDSIGRIQWMKASGNIINFTYNTINDVFKIINVYRKPHNSGANTILDIEYNGKTFSLQQNSLNSEYIFKQMDIAIDYKYSVNEIINNSKIINREHTKKNYGNIMKWYLLKCVECDYEYWKTEYTINSGEGCPCCTKYKKVIMKGINDIATTDPWMIKFLYNKNDAYKYSCCSNKKVYMVCPYCNKKTDHKILLSNLYKRKYVSCVCNDAISYPNKFIYAFVNQLNVTDIECEFMRPWLGNKRFDIYFVYKNNKYIIEMDGGLGHGNMAYGNKKDVDGLKNDKYKEELAAQHDIQVIRVNAIKSDMEYLKTSIENTKLSTIFDLNSIDWIECEKYALNNLVNKICKDYEDDIFLSTKDLSKKYQLSEVTVSTYLSRGKNVGWVTYMPTERKVLTWSKSNPICVDDKYYFSCRKIFEKYQKELFNFKPYRLAKCLNSLNKNKNDVLDERIIKIVSKEDFKKKYKENSEFVYIF